LPNWSGCWRMTRSLELLERVVLRKEVDRDRIKRDLAETVTQYAVAVTDVAEWEAARELVVEVLLVTQERVREFVEDVVSSALASTYGEDYGFRLTLERKRGQAEARPEITVGDDAFSPREEVGGGVLDVASLAMRLALWALAEPRPAPVFLLDEPSKFLSADLQPRFGDMLRELADSLGVQFIVVTHSPSVASAAGAAYNVTQEGGISRVERTENSDAENGE